MGLVALRVTVSAVLSLRTEPDAVSEARLHGLQFCSVEYIICVKSHSTTFFMS